MLVEPNLGISTNEPYYSGYRGYRALLCVLWGGNWVPTDLISPNMVTHAAEGFLSST